MFVLHSVLIHFPISYSSKTHTMSNLVGTQKAIGVGPPNEALLFVILSPVGPYFPNGFKPVSLFGTTEYVRAAPGGASIAPSLP